MTTFATLKTALEKRSSTLFAINSKTGHESTTWARFLLEISQTPFKAIEGASLQEAQYHLDSPAFTTPPPCLLLIQPESPSQLHLEKTPPLFFALENQAAFLKQITVSVDWSHESTTERENRYRQLIEELSAASGRKISASAVALLLARVGQDPFALFQEIKKCDTALELGAPINQEAIEQLVCSKENTVSLWQVADALLKEEFSNAFHLMKIAQKNWDPILTLKTCRNLFSRSLQIASMAEAGMSRIEIQSRFPQIPQKFIDQEIRRALKWSVSLLTQALFCFDHLEQRVKNGEYPPELCLELLVAKLSTLSSSQ